jgi:hypothetical protein
VCGAADQSASLIDQFERGEKKAALSLHKSDRLASSAENF